MLDECLWVYRTMVRTLTKAMSLSLVYGCEVILSIEVQILSPRVALIIVMIDEVTHQFRLQDLETLDDKCLQAQKQIDLYQARISKVFNKKVEERTFKIGDPVLVVRRLMAKDSQKKRKFSTQAGKAVFVEAVYSIGAYA